jgi:hypothetical protein
MDMRKLSALLDTIEKIDTLKDKDNIEKSGRPAVETFQHRLLQCHTAGLRDYREVQPCSVISQESLLWDTDLQRDFEEISAAGGIIRRCDPEGSYS